MKIIHFVKITALTIGLTFAGMANAAFPAGLWQLDQYDFVSKVKINTQYSCIKADGTAKLGGDPTMATFDWTGNWKNTGDLVLLRFNNLTPSGVASYSLIRSNPKLMTGYNVSWDVTVGTATGPYVTSAWTFKKATC